MAEEGRPRIVFRVPGMVLPERDRSQTIIIEMGVVLVIIVVLMGILWPLYRSTTATARTAVCLDRLRRLGQMMTMYSQDYDEHYPPLPQGRDLENATRPVVKRPMAWTVMLEPYRERKGDMVEDPFTCPAAEAPTYAYNAALGARVFPRYDPMSAPMAQAAVANPSRTLLLYDTANRVLGANSLTGFRFFYGSVRQGRYRPGDFVLPTGGVREGWIRPRHAGGSNALYCDGHVRRIDDPAVRLEAKDPFDPAAP